ncbi:MAG: PDZ domain-containing protein [Bacteroidales bacterium]|jgi:carboxyl-terminal processing protease|nr:PDZ domain-containing protein [Bacteroidales bacterium]
MKTTLTLAVALMLMAATASTAQTGQNEFIDKIIAVGRLIHENYADTIDRNRLVEITIRSVFGYLDPHTQYKTPQEAAEDEKNFGADRTGIGAAATRLHDTLTIVSVEAHTPAYKAGLRAGMQIDSINGEPVTNRVLSDEQMVKIINSREDSISLSLIRGKGRKKIVIPRYSIRNASIESYYSPNDSTTYIKIFKFTKYTGEDFEKVLKEFGRKELRNVIIDLRDNPGGVLQVCSPICNQIVPANMVLYTACTSHEEPKPEFSNKNGHLKNSRIYILINENSASASEVIASCIQDNDRGIIIGRRSFGKALTQQVSILPDGSKVLISNGRIYSPSGRCIQKDYIRGNFNEYNNELNLRKQRRENVCRDSICTAGKPQKRTVMKHRTVHGNMGVIPDCFVPEDSTNVIPVTADKHSLYDDMKFFAIIFVDDHRQRLRATYGSFKNFCKTFFVSDRMVADFYNYRKNKSYSLRNTLEAQMTSTQETIIHKHIKAFVAKAMYGDNEFRELINETDSDFQAAMRLIADPNAYWNYLK